MLQSTGQTSLGLSLFINTMKDFIYMISICVKLLTLHLYTCREMSERL